MHTELVDPYTNVVDEPGRGRRLDVVAITHSVLVDLGVVARRTAVLGDVSQTALHTHSEVGRRRRQRRK
jgi:hypothetical protein